MKTIQKMYEHLNWANQRILDTLQSSGNEKQQVLRLFSHILFAEKVWITRLLGLDSSQLQLWSEVDINVCEDILVQNEKSFTVLLTSLTNADLDKFISYKNSKGIEFKNSIRDVLTHVALHGQYHRGQINSRLRTAGIEPVSIDYITFFR